MTLLAAPITKYWSTITKNQNISLDEDIKDTEVKTKIKGDLRSRIITAFELNDLKARVFITEIKTFTGRDTTQEKWHSFAIIVHSKRDNYEKHFTTSENLDSFNAMLFWLDQKAPIER